MKSYVVSLAALLLPSAASAGVADLLNSGFEAANPVVEVSAAKTASGRFGDMVWEARSKIVAMTSTATVATGGSPTFLAPKPQYNGVASLIMNYGAGGSFICTGTLLGDRVSIVTAAHCVSDGAGTAGPLTTTAFFNNATDPVNHIDPTSTALNVSRIIVNQGYTGQVVDQNDIAILRLAQAAPSWINSYDFDFTTPVQGEQLNIAGYGGRWDGVGPQGANIGTGRLRQGDNTYDFRFGDARFGGFWNRPNVNRPGSTNFFGTAQIRDSWIYDFDNGTSTNDASCRIGNLFSPTTFCNTGVGAREVGSAGGDSGGPNFVGGKIKSVTSYGLTFGTGLGDCRTGLNSSCGELNGVVPVSIHQNFITNAMAVPEPSSWAMLIAGFGLTGAVMRRRRAVAA
ncbi:MAG: hypothetical protein CFE37_03005 [Alphaproteobacteria bacterium PA4]|nr:MAG: hypothetical protein CFE37_03005 [Alphaproteobacteria bacterium PA4]